MSGVRHPFSRALYECEGDGIVRVTVGQRTGRFTSDGRWLSGALREADPQLCGWVGGKRMTSKRVSGAVPLADGTPPGTPAPP